MLGLRQMTMGDYLGIVRRRLWLIVVPAILGCVGAYMVSRVLPKKFTSMTLVLVERPTVSDTYVKPLVTEELNQRLASMQEQILSRTRLQPIIERFGLYRNDVNNVPMEELVNRLRSTIKITPIAPMAETRASNLPGFYVAVNSDNAAQAQQICSQVTSMFIDENLKLRQSQAEDTTQFISKQLEEAKGRLDEQDSRLASFKRQSIGALPENEQTNLNLLMGLTTQLDAASQALGRAQQDKGFAETLLAQQVAAWKATQQGQSPVTMDQQLTKLQSELLELRPRYTDDHPDVIKKKAEIEQLQQRIATTETNKEKEKTPQESSQLAALVEPQEIQQLRGQIHQYETIIREKTKQQEDIQKQIKVYEARVQLSPMIEQQYKELTRDYQTAYDFYNELQKKRDQSAMAMDLERRQQGEQFRVLDPASLPEEPSFPKPPLFAAGGLGGGLAFGIALSLLFEISNRSMRTEQDVEFFLRLPTLATVPPIDKKTKVGWFSSRRDRAQLRLNTDN